MLSVLSHAGAGSFLVFLFYPFMSFWDVMAWKFCFSRELSPRIRISRLFFIRLAGEALNNVTPFIDIGGEPLKIHWLHRDSGISMASAGAATVVARTSLLLSEAFFMLLGVVLSFKLIPLESKYRIQLIAVLFFVCLVFVVFLGLQQRDWLKKLNPEISRYYSTHGNRFWTALPLNGLGWVSGGVEMYFFCRILGIDISILEGVMLEALLQLVRTGSFFIPGNLGAQEGGLAFLIGQMGFDPVLGVGLSLLKRFRQILWTGVGFFVWGIFKRSHLPNS